MFQSRTQLVSTTIALTVFGALFSGPSQADTYTPFPAPGDITFVPTSQPDPSKYVPTYEQDCTDDLPSAVSTAVLTHPANVSLGPCNFTVRSTSTNAVLTGTVAQQSSGQTGTATITCSGTMSVSGRLTNMTFGTISWTSQTVPFVGTVWTPSGVTNPSFSATITSASATGSQSCTWNVAMQANGPTHPAYTLNGNLSGSVSASAPAQTIAPGSTINFTVKYSLNGAVTNATGPYSGAVGNLSYSQEQNMSMSAPTGSASNTVRFVGSSFDPSTLASGANPTGTLGDAKLAIPTLSKNVAVSIKSPTNKIWKGSSKLSLNVTSGSSCVVTVKVGTVSKTVSGSTSGAVWTSSKTGAQTLHLFTSSSSKTGTLTATCTKSGLNRKVLTVSSFTLKRS